MDENQKKVMSLLILAIYDAIKTAGKEGIPSGSLYNMLMGKISLHIYQAIINALVDSGKVTNTGHLLRAVN